MHLLRIRPIVVLWMMTLLPGGCGHHAPPLQRHQYVHGLMGVQVKLIVYAADEESARTAAKAAFDRVAQLEAVMSDYQRDSELMRLCAQAGQGPVKVSDDLLRVLDYAQRLAQASGGAFDVTIGPLVTLWRAARKSGTLPSPQQIAEAKSKVGWRLMKIDRDAGTVELLRAGMKLDLGGIGKGYAGDEAIKVLRRHGIRSALYEAGGDIVVSGAPPAARGWKIELSPGLSFAPETVTLKNAAISTSGDTVQYVEIDGVRYSHVVDPQTGLGLNEHSMATVIAPRGMTTDALSTTATLVGPKRGQSLCRTFRATRCWIGKSP